MSAAPVADPLASWVSRVIAIGTTLAVGLVAVGVLLALVAGADAGTPPAGTGLLEQIAARKPASIVAIGLLLLALTPVAQLAAAAAAFARRGEHRYLLVSSLVLVLLAAGIVVATVFARS